MLALLSLLAYDREDLMVAALAGLMVAGAVVAIGAWLLFFRERRGPATGSTEPAEVPEVRSGDSEP
jgi:hypothetical protein